MRDIEPEHTMSEIDSAREHLVETYRKRARHYDITAPLSSPRSARNRPTAAGPHERFGFARVTAWSRSLRHGTQLPIDRAGNRSRGPDRRR